MKKNKLALFSIPYVIWMALFVVAPIIMVVIYAFTAAPPDGGFTLANFSRMGDYAVVFARSFQLAIIATLICVLIGYPVAYFMAKEGPGFQRTAMMIIMLPMWLNFLLRTYSWLAILEKNGFLNQFFSAIGLFNLINNIFGTDITYFKMIGTSGAVVLGMVYNYLPYMVLPLYTIMVKIDNSVIEAAQDLGANVYHVVAKVLVPLSMPGITTGITMVFVPSISTFIISRMLGGGSNLLIGDLIELQFLGNSYNYNLGSAMSLVLMVIVLLCMSFTTADTEEMEAMV